MNRIKHILFATSVVAGLATGAIALTSRASAEAATEMHMPTTAADYLADAARYEQEATKLDANADRHAKMAALYRAPSTGGSKQDMTFRSLANHCERLAEFYRQAALEARAMAKEQRAMAQAT